MSDKLPDLLTLTVLSKDIVMKGESLCGKLGCHTLRYSRNPVQVGGPGTRVPLSTHRIGPLTRDNVKVEATGPKPRSYPSHRR